MQSIWQSLRWLTVPDLVLAGFFDLVVLLIAIAEVRGAGRAMLIAMSRPNDGYDGSVYILPLRCWAKGSGASGPARPVGA